MQEKRTYKQKRSFTCISSVSQFLDEQIILRISLHLVFVFLSLCHLHSHPPLHCRNPLVDPPLPLALRSPCGASVLVFFFLYLGGKFFCYSPAAILSMLALLQPLCQGDYFPSPRPVGRTGALAHPLVPL